MKQALFSAAYEAVSKTDHTIGHKANFREFENTEVTPYILAFLHSVVLSDYKQQWNKSRNQYQECLQALYKWRVNDVLLNK